AGRKPHPRQHEHPERQQGPLRSYRGTRRQTRRNVPGACRPVQSRGTPYLWDAMTAEQQDMFNRNVMLALLELRDLLEGKMSPQARASIKHALNERLDVLSQTVTGINQRDKRMKD